MANAVEHGSSLPASPGAPESWSLYSSWQRWGLFTLLFLVTTSNYFDYFILSVVLQPIKDEFHVSDTMLGLLSGLCFAVVYAVAGLPIARWADRGNRRTIITLALAAWSGMTALCGFTQTFWQLALARFGLGLVEPGAMPPAQSLIADYFPPQRRAMALAALNSGSAAGWLVGVGVGGYIAATRGWRSAFLWAGAVGIGLAVALRLLLSEPRLRLGFPDRTGSETIGLAIHHLIRKPSFLWVLAAISVYTIFAYGTNIFLPSYMIRSLNASLKQVSVTWGIAIAGANILGALAGGWIGDRLSRRDVRWYAWLPAMACVLSIPIYEWALSATDLNTFIIIDFAAELTLAIGYATAFAALHAVCGNARRATAVAIVFFLISLVGSGLGPLVAGVLSDALGTMYGIESLRYSLIIMVGFLAPAAGMFYGCARLMPRDLEA
jgi:predicted MFS family arabinose efflux permease